MDRDKALDMAVGQIEKQYGKGAVMRLGDQANQTVACIPTGAISLDLALGVGGIPRGRVTEIYGPEASGKTTVALHVVAEAQQAGGIAAFIDAEHALDPSYAKALGVDTEELLVSQPDTGEQALEIADMLVRSGAVDVIVIDSVAALTPKAEIEGEMGDSHVGLQARLMSQALRKLSGTLHRSRTSAVFINQLREKVGVMFGSPETTPGGRALKFYSSVRLDVRRIESLKDGNDAIGNRVRVKVVKNKCLAADTRVFDAATGETHRIEEIVENQRPVTVWAADKRGKLYLKQVTDWFNQGEQTVIPLVLRDGTTVRATPDHLMLTDRGWRPAGELAPGDRLGRPRSLDQFGCEQPVKPEHARMLGYLIGDGYVGGKTPVAFINVEPSLKDDAEAIASALGCRTDRRLDGNYLTFSHRKQEENGVLKLARWAGIWGCLAPEKRIPPEVLSSDVTEEVLANLLFGLWESDGWISREQTGGIRCGYTTTSEQLAWQVHWMLLRWGVGSSVRRAEAGSRRSVIDGRRIQGRLPTWEVRVSGLDNVERLSSALPTWGPRGQRLRAELEAVDHRVHRGSSRMYLSESQTAPVLDYLNQLGVTARYAAVLIGDGAGDPRGGLKQVLGSNRLRRDRVERLRDALDSGFLGEILDEDLFYDRIEEIGAPEQAATYDVEVADLHNLVADDVVVHNCAPPFRQAEFDLMYGHGISKEGSLLDLGVDHGIVKKAGAWYTYEGEQLGQGRENAKKFLAEHEDVANTITKQLHEQLGLVQTDVTGDDAVAETESAGEAEVEPETKASKSAEK